LSAFQPAAFDGFQQDLNGVLPEASDVPFLGGVAHSELLVAWTEAD
jgi:hypothetical protein